MNLFDKMAELISGKLTEVHAAKQASLTQIYQEHTTAIETKKGEADTALASVESAWDSAIATKNAELTAAYNEAKSSLNQAIYGPEYDSIVAEGNFSGIAEALVESQGDILTAAKAKNDDVEGELASIAILRGFAGDVIAYGVNSWGWHSDTHYYTSAELNSASGLVSYLTTAIATAIATEQAAIAAWDTEKAELQAKSDAIAADIASKEADVASGAISNQEAVAIIPALKADKASKDHDIAEGDSKRAADAANHTAEVAALTAYKTQSEAEVVSLNGVLADLEASVNADKADAEAEKAVIEANKAAKQALKAKLDTEIAESNAKYQADLDAKEAAAADALAAYTAAKAADPNSPDTFAKLSDFRDKNWEAKKVEDEMRDEVLALEMEAKRAEKDSEYHGAELISINAAITALDAFIAAKF